MDPAINEVAGPAEAILERTQRLADDVLFPTALDVDAAPIIPKERLDLLADVGLYGLAGPAEAGGLGIDPAMATQMLEIVAGRCHTSPIDRMQHHGTVVALSRVAPPHLRDEWLQPMCRGQRRAGVAFAGLRRPGPPILTARHDPDDDGWILNGTAPWVTGWDRIDVVHAAARDEDPATDGQIVWSLIDAVEGPTLTAAPLRLAAVNAGATVTLSFREHHVPASRVMSIEPFADWRLRDAGGLRMNGSLSLGLAARCCTLLGPSRFDAEVADCRADLDAARPESMPSARAAASDLAMRAASAVVVAGGGRSILVDQQAQRLAREAMFLLVFGQTPAIRAAQMARHEL